jgi:disulfide bond formation protein DsbB
LPKAAIARARFPSFAILVSVPGSIYICAMLQKTIGPRRRRSLLVAVVLVSLAALAAAFAGQYLFGLEPCILCLYERIPWAVAALIAGLGVIGWAGWQASWSVLLCAVVLAAGAALAFYHVGVEQHWWGSVAGCVGEPIGGLTLDDLRPEALARQLKPCDRVDWRLFGLSLAGYNAIISMLVSLVCLASLVANARTPAP